MKLLDLINSLASKCGKQNEKTIIDLLSRSDLQNIDIADDVANPIDTLLTIDAAKNNNVIRNHFNALALGSMDTEILNTIKKLELGDEFETELSGVKSTYEKQRKLTEKIFEVHTALRAARGNGNEKDIEKYTKQINDLNAKISKYEETHISKKELDRVRKESENAVLDYMLQSKLSGLNYANRDVSADVNAKLARIILDEALKKGDAILVNENNTMKLKRANEPTLDYYDTTNKAVSIDDFMDKTFADAKILAVSGGKGNPQNPPYVPPVQFQTQGQPQPGLSEFQAEVQNQINALN
jgi:hypothetical protein